MFFMGDARLGAGKPDNNDVNDVALSRETPDIGRLETGRDDVMPYATFSICAGLYPSAAPANIAPPSGVLVCCTEVGRAMASKPPSKWRSGRIVGMTGNMVESSCELGSPCWLVAVREPCVVEPRDMAGELELTCIVGIAGGNNLDEEALAAFNVPRPGILRIRSAEVVDAGELGMSVFMASMRCCACFNWFVSSRRPVKRFSFVPAPNPEVMPGAGARIDAAEIERVCPLVGVLSQRASLPCVDADPDVPLRRGTLVGVVREPSGCAEDATMEPALPCCDGKYVLV
jgi:hypothetical protein